MKYTSLFFFLSIFLFSCKKEYLERNEPEYMVRLKSMLQAKLSESDFLALDFEKIYITRIDSAELYINRIGLKNKDIAKDFVIVRTDQNNIFLEGCYFHIQMDRKRGQDGYYYSSGSVTVTALNRTKKIVTKFTDNKIDSEKLRSIELTAIPGPPMPPMPEPPPPILFPNNEDFDSPLLDYMKYLRSVGEKGPSNSMGSGYHWPANPPTPTNTRPQPEEPMYIEENYDGGPGIDIEKFVKCFNSISDVNAKFSISLMVDIPINNNPGALVNWRDHFPGHTFIQLTKSNGSQKIIQNIGFYPATSFKSLSFLSVSSKIADDSRHEFNASISMNLSAEQFLGILTSMPLVAKMWYDIARYNCTDFAVDVFNLARGENPIVVSQIVLPNYLPGQIPSVSSTPRELYKQLEKMKNAGGPEAANISIYPQGQRAEWGNGPCD